jgi:hypothetical protein
MTENERVNRLLRQEAKLMTKKYPNSPMPGRALHLKSVMKVQHGQDCSYTECISALTDVRKIE